MLGLLHCALLIAAFAIGTSAQLADPITRHQGDISLKLAHASRRSLRSAAEYSFIVGGTNVTSGYNYVALVQQGNDPTDADSVCTGSLIASSTVLTAGHCCYTDSADSEDGSPAGYIDSGFQILLGAYSLSGDIFQESQTTPLAERTAVNTLVPDEYQNGDDRYDVCVITLNQSVSSSIIKPVTVVKSGRAVPSKGSTVTAVGWGRQEITGDAPITHLAMINKQVAACPASDTSTFPSGARAYVCYSAKGGSGCSGDSGGPLLSNGTLVAIDSFGQINKSVPNDPGCSISEEYLNIAAPEISDFITQNTV